MCFNFLYLCRRELNVVCGVCVSVGLYVCLSVSLCLFVSLSVCLSACEQDYSKRSQAIFMKACRSRMDYCYGRIDQIVGLIRPRVAEWHFIYITEYSSSYSADGAAVVPFALAEYALS